MVCTVTKRSALCAGVIGVVFLALGIILVAGDHALLHEIIQKVLVIDPKNSIFANWVSLPTPILTSIYFFNVTNAVAVEKNGSKPELQEIGPYVYQEFHRKVKLRWNNENETITYQQIRTYEFVPEMSSGSIHDKITTLNAPAATVNSMSMPASSFVKGLINLGLKAIKEKLFVTKTVEELLFKGYKDPIITDSAKVPAWIMPKQDIDRFGYFYPRNGSDWYDGVFNMFTGKGNISQLGQVHSWNYSTNPGYYPSPCGDVHGAGDFFSPDQKKTYVELYSNDLCRPLRAEFEYPQTIDGIKGYMYKISPQFFANSTENPNNWCFNPNKSTPSGVFNASVCRFGSPLFMSQPHFYQADPFFLRGVKSGLKPNASKHETSFFVEPQSGIPLEVKARFQVNFLIEPIPEIKMFEKIRRTFFPTVS
jgi:scavenger receptor class B protein 1